MACAGHGLLYERIARSPIGEGWIERMHFADSCASLWIDGELVHLENLVLHDATKDVRTPTHELTIARDVLKTRRRVAAQPPGWALWPEGLERLREQASLAAVQDADAPLTSSSADPDAQTGGEEEGENGDDSFSSLDAEFGAIDAVLARSEAAIKQAKTPGPARAREKDPLIYDLD